MNPVLRTASMPKLGSYSTIRTFLNVVHPVFHAATLQQFSRGLKRGIRADGNYPEFRGAGVNGIPFLRNLDLLMTNPYNRPYIFVFDLDQLSIKYQLDQIEIPDEFGGFALVLRSGVIPRTYIRGLVVEGRLFDMRSRVISKPGSPPKSLPSKIVPRLRVP